MSNTVPTTQRTDDSPVRFGVIGAGFIAHWFAEAVAREPGAQIVAVTSAHRERAAAFATEHGIAHAYASLEEMLAAHGPGSPDPIDVIHVGSPNSLHTQHSIAALEAGFHAGGRPLPHGGVAVRLRARGGSAT